MNEMSAKSAYAAQTSVIPPGVGTIAKLFWSTVTARGDTPAMTHKDFGIWKSFTWRDYGEHAKLTGLALLSLGLKPGDLVAILAESIPEWLFTDMGAIGAGGVSVGIYPTSSRDQVAYVLSDSGARFVFVEDEEQLDKVLEKRDELPAVDKIIVYDMKGLRSFDDPAVMSYDALLDLGRDYEKSHPDAWTKALDVAKPEDPAIFVYTSGTTGPPKGAKLSHANLIFAIEHWREFAPTTERDHTLAFLPLCHMAERMMTGLRPLGYGGIINFAESPDTVLENLQEVSPTVFIAVPRIWEKLYALVQMSLGDGTAFERWAYKRAIKVGEAVAERRVAGKPIPFGLRALYAIADLLVLRNTRRLIGMSKARLIGSGAAPISPDLMRWYLALGIPMFELYGQTECSGVGTFYGAEEYRVGTVGRALADTELKLAEDGEILMRGPHVFMGYHNKPDRTADAIDSEGWLHTGDIGVLTEDGYLKITDRKSDIIITSGGKNITPSEIENKLKFSPYITDAVVIGDGRKFVSALIMIDQDNVEKYALRQRIVFTDYASLTRAQGVHDLVSAEVERVNKTLASVEQIKAFRLLDVLLTAEDEEMTPTLKLRRKFVHEKYGAEIDAMYGKGGAG
jgi:long-chain acyl-CoA synthetase